MAINVCQFRIRWFRINSNNSTCSELIDSGSDSLDNVTSCYNADSRFAGGATAVSLVLTSV